MPLGCRPLVASHARLEWTASAANRISVRLSRTLHSKSCALAHKPWTPPHGFASCVSPLRKLMPVRRACVPCISVVWHGIVRSFSLTCVPVGLCASKRPLRTDSDSDTSTPVRSAKVLQSSTSRGGSGPIIGTASSDSPTCSRPPNGTSLNYELGHVPASWDRCYTQWMLLRSRRSMRAANEQYWPNPG
jgi:hypothetical protein